MLEPTNTVKTLIRNSSTPGKPGLGRKIHPMKQTRQLRPDPQSEIQRTKKECHKLTERKPEQSFEKSLPSADGKWRRNPNSGKSWETFNGFSEGALVVLHALSWPETKSATKKSVDIKIIILIASNNTKVGGDPRTRMQHNRALEMCERGLFKHKG